MAKAILETEQKALEINLDHHIYGTFAEIGAGQEVARYFFQAGGSSGTIAKTMSAYDKTYSDAIYGSEPSGRYVSEARIYKMLDHEYSLMEERIRLERPETSFFSFANTVAAINYQRTIKGNGWMGLRFQTSPNSAPNNMVLHARMLDNDNRLQQDAIGILGVNLIYACYYFRDDMQRFLSSLMDNLKDRIFIDMINVEGPEFEQVNHRLLCLDMVRLGLTDVVMFNPEGKCVQVSEFLYKKSVLVVRSRFRPVTVINWEMFNSGLKQFREDLGARQEDAFLLTEITLDDLRSRGSIDKKDFLDRVTALAALDQVVVISNCQQHQKLITYLLDYKILNVGFVMSIWHLKDIIQEKFDQNKEGALIASFGELFSKKVRIYAYPAYEEESGKLLKAAILPVPEGMQYLYLHLLQNKHIVDIKEFTPEILQVYSKEVLRSLRNNEPGWEEMVPPGIADLIKKEHLFGLEEDMI
ncbi:MAG: TonB-dependent receptor [Saprospiraceae bacterium]|nr:TonB-dependent receptor [Saprospiraceae bacterium]